MRAVCRAIVKDTPGGIKVWTKRSLSGSDQFPSERIRVGHAKFVLELHEHLHWHPIDVFYHLLSGSTEMIRIALNSMRDWRERRLQQCAINKHSRPHSRVLPAYTSSLL